MVHVLELDVWFIFRRAISEMETGSDAGEGGAETEVANVVDS